MKIIKYNNKWVPIGEDGKEVLPSKSFNKKFPIDMTFAFKTFFRRYRIRFVQHKDVAKDEIKVFTLGLYKKWLFWKYKTTNSGGKMSKDIIDERNTLKITDAEKIYGINFKNFKK
jgi:hypothetical protein